MSALPVGVLGRRIREQRLRRGVSLRALARTVGVSASLVSQIETGKSQPSVSTLYALTTALGLTLEEVFGSAGPDGAAADDAVVDGAAAVGAAASADSDSGEAAIGPVHRPDRRQLLRLDSGVTWERLGPGPGGRVDFLLITYEPGGTSSGSGRLMRHPGTEYGYLLRGSLVLSLGFDQHRMRPGDSVCFESSTPHGYRNEDREPAVGVWFVDVADS